MKRDSDNNSHPDDALDTLRQAIRERHYRGFFLPLLLAICAVLWCSLDSTPRTMVRYLLFDTYQQIHPRQRINDGVVVVAIDEESLAQLGQWPWPRDKLATLIEKINAAQPAAIVIDAIFPESDRHSPHLLGTQFADLLGPAAHALPNTDEILSTAILQAPVVLGMLAIEADQRIPSMKITPILQRGGNALDYVLQYPSLIRSIDTIHNAAAGYGLINGPLDRGVIRRLPAVAGINGNLVPGFAIETLRVLTGSTELSVELDKQGIKQFNVGEIGIPTDSDGTWWLHFSDHRERLAISAADIITATEPDERLHGRIVLFGFTAYGLLDFTATPISYVPGLHIHAEALDNVIDGRLLKRPAWAEVVEPVAAFLLSILGIGLLVVATPLTAITIFLVVVTVFILAGLQTFISMGLLIDTLNPVVAASFVLMAMLTVFLAETQIQRRRLRVALAASRESAARLDGELDAAKRIQIGMLPTPAVALANDPRVDAAAIMLPARTVGGDFYDFVKFDDQHLFFMVGDVAGKGVPASLFMALSKALIRSYIARDSAHPGRAISAAAQELSEGNSEMLFLTAFAAVLNLSDGRLIWTNAGHEPPWILCKPNGKPGRLSGDSGPPICVLDDYEYLTHSTNLEPGTLLAVVTDGVTEAEDRSQNMFGYDRLDRCFTNISSKDNTEDALQRIYQAVADFTGDAEQSDDITILLLQWRGK